MPLAEKRGFAHFEVDTSGPVPESDRAADALAGELLALAGEGREARTAATRVLLGGLLHGPDEGPRGLAPASLLAAAAEAGGLELQEVARGLTPAAAGPWYETAREAEPRAAAANLAVALAVWAACRGSADAAFVAAAAGSIARLTHTDAAARADACVLAMVAHEVALSAAPPLEPEALARRAEPLATRFGGAPPKGALGPVWTAVRACPRDPAGARAECARLGGDAALAGGLAGLGAPFDDSARAGELQATLDVIRSSSA
jgi:hypothetical protein